jgi:hypoxanthine phosphoribosyltransferase
MNPIKKPKKFISKKRIADRVGELGGELAKDYKNKDLSIVALSNGAVVFTADLIRKIDIPLRLDVISVHSYVGQKSSGKISLNSTLRLDVSGRHVLLVDDILDTGRTVLKVIEHLKTHNPKEVKVCVLLDKPSRRVADVKSDYAGFEIPDKFVVGYGLDYNEHYRNLPYIGILQNELE